MHFGLSLLLSAEVQRWQIRRLQLMRSPVQWADFFRSHYQRRCDKALFWWCTFLLFGAGVFCLVIGTLKHLVKADLEGSCQITRASTFTCDHSEKTKWDTTFRNVEFISSSGSVWNSCSTFVSDRGKDSDCGHANAMIQKESLLDCSWMQDGSICKTEDVLDADKKLGRLAFAFGVPLTLLGLAAIGCFCNYLRYPVSSPVYDASPGPIGVGTLKISGPPPPEVKIKIEIIGPFPDPEDLRKQAEEDAATLQRR